MRIILIFLLLVSNTLYAQGVSKIEDKLSDSKVPKIAQIFMDKGHEKIGLGDIDGAAKNWGKAMEYYSPFKAFYFVIADYYLKAGEIKKACSYYLKTANYDSFHEQARMELGVCEIRSRNWKKAIYYFNESLNLLPNQAIAYFYIATSYGVLKEHRMAKKNLTKALSLDSKLKQSIDSQSVLYKYLK